MVRPVKTKKIKIVPNIPKVRTYPMCSKKRLLHMFNPEAKMIGGKHTKKKISPSNFSSSDSLFTAK